MTARPPVALRVAVACVAAAMLLTEIVVTRLFSVLFFYHFSFFAVTLVMSGLVVGGLLAGRWDARSLPERVFRDRLGLLALAFAAGTALALAVVVLVGESQPEGSPSALLVATRAAVFLPGLAAAGAFLALAFARDRTWIGGLYAWDLVAAAAGCAGSMIVLRALPGPASLVVPAALAAVAAWAIAAGRAPRTVALLAATSAFAIGVANHATGGRLLRLSRERGAPPVLLERWNEHSRVVAAEFPGFGRYLVIDRTAGTLMLPIPRDPSGGPPNADPSWAKGEQYLAYHAGRPVRNVAVIGIGGGADLRPALYWGARRVDGYELNQTFIDLLTRDFADFNALASRPEVHLHHTEGRVGIARADAAYDLIQASLIDTWAATASGGFVLSENGLYTREGWRTFLRHLSAGGILTMTRWYVPDAPAEMRRLVALAATALSDEGYADVASRIVLLRTAPGGGFGPSSDEVRGTATILVSKQPFSADEVERLRVASAGEHDVVAAAPGVGAEDEVVRKLLSPTMRKAAIGSDAFDIAPPTDDRPYFFLQVRPTDWLTLTRTAFGSVTQITFNGVRVMLVLSLLSTALVLVVTALTVLGLPGRTATDEGRRTYRLMTVYFLGIGVGYVLVQLGLHQRLILFLGHPSLALTVVLFSMLLGTGAGSASSNRLYPDGSTSRAFVVVLSTLAAAWLSLFALPLLEAATVSVRVAVAGGLLFVVGFVLGSAFPIGVRIVGRTGEWATQKMWALNGAASIAGSVLAPLIGLSCGSSVVLACGLAAYGVAAVAVGRASRSQISPGFRPLAAPSP
ncbi:MAG TPA: hypothetical protein VHE30_06905 [Polyangiaceae bacterium]|nr:hypothetical protein [Polyangiaceae bacterium]